MNDPLQAYIDAANRIPLLGADEERELVRRLAGGDEAAASPLLLAHLRLVISIARSFPGYGLPAGDLIQRISQIESVALARMRVALA